MKRKKTSVNLVRLDFWFVITISLLFGARAEDAAAGARVRAHNIPKTSRPKTASAQQQFRKETRRISSSHSYREDGQWAGQRSRSHQMAMKTSSAFGVSFLKCAQVDAGGEVAQLRVTLVVSNPEEGHDLSQLCIRDSVSDLMLLQTNGSLQERGFQTFSTDTLTAGSQYVVLYRMSVKANRNQSLNLPAFLTFSNATQNDIHLFGPVEANFTLTVKTTEQVYVEGSVLGVVFMVSLLLVLLLVCLGGVCVVAVRRRRICSCARLMSASEQPEPYEGMSDITASANEEAEFEDKFVDIVMLEDPQNMNEALDSVNWSSLSCAAVAVERLRVTLFKGLLSALLAGVREDGRLKESGERRVLGVLHGQILGMEGKMQEEQALRMEALAAQCKLETQEEMEDLQRKHMSEAAHAEQLIQHATPQEALELQALLEELHEEEQKRLRRRLLVRHEHARAQAQRQQALRRRFELHKIFSEELEEASRTGELDKSTADRLLQQYYSCQDDLEEVLDVLLANQRAQLEERHAQRRFLVQSLQSLQTAMSDVFSSSAARIRDWSTHTHGVSQQCSDVLLEIMHVKQNIDERVSRERSAVRCDIIKRRRQILSEKVCERWRQLQAVCDSSDLTVHQFLQKWTEVLMKQNEELSEVISHLDEETALRTRKMTLSLLQSSVAQLKACAATVCPGAACLLPQTEDIQESVQRLGKVAARELRATESRIRLQKQQELQEQSCIRDTLREYCSCLCVCQPSLSHEQRLRLQLECVKAMCGLDRCLMLHHAIFELKLHGTDSSDPGVTPAGAETEGSSGVTELQSFLRCIQERLQAQHRVMQTDTLQQEASVFQEQQLCVCQERLAVFVASLQWERAEARVKVTETHSALLKLQTLITAELHHADVTHTINTHRLALEEAELRLQQEEDQWVDCVEGRGCSSEEAEQEGVFMVSGDSSVSVLLQEALFKRQQLQCLTDRLLTRNQALEHQKEQLQLNRLQTYCEQDLAFAAALVKQSLMSAPDLHEVLRLLLPTVPEGELLSLIDALRPGAGDGWGRHGSLSDRLRLEVLSVNLSDSQHTDSERDRDRLLKKCQKRLDKLLSSDRGSEDIHESQNQRRRRRTRDLPEPEPSTTGAELMNRGDNEGVWPHGSVDSMRDVNEAQPVGVPKDSLDSMRDVNEGVWPVGVAQCSVESPERVFVFRCVPPTAQQQQQHTQTPRKKKRSFLNFKKGSVAPQPHTSTLCDKTL